MSYRIITDSGCDLPESICRQFGITCVPMALHIGQQEIKSASLQSFYAAMRAGATGTTTAVNPAAWCACIEPILKAGEDVLVLAFSSGLSSTAQNAELAARELRERYPQRKIRVADTLCASLGQGLLVYAACRKRDAGMDLESLYTWCQARKKQLCHWFTVDDLAHLHRGGRVSTAAVLMGTMLQIKPVLHTDDEGRLTPMVKVRGRRASLDALVTKYGELALPGIEDTVFISHGDCPEDAQYVQSRLKEKYGVENVIIHYIGAVIGSHSGPGTVALFFFGKHR